MTNSGKTDFERVDDETELARQERVDPDLNASAAAWFAEARLEFGIPTPPSASNKRPVTIRLDPEVVDYFKNEGRGWQTRINAVLKAFVTDRQTNR